MSIYVYMYISTLFYATSSFLNQCLLWELPKGNLYRCLNRLNTQIDDIHPLVSTNQLRCVSSYFEMNLWIGFVASYYVFANSPYNVKHLLETMVKRREKKTCLGP